MKKIFVISIALFSTSLMCAMEKFSEIYPCKSLPVTIHKDFYRPLVARLQQHKHIKDLYYDDFHSSKELCTVTIKSKNIVYLDKNMDRFHHVLAQKKIGKNAQRKLKNIIAAYKELSEYRMRDHVFLGQDGVIRMIGGWEHVFAPDIMEYFYNLYEDLPALCAIAKIKYVR